MPQEAEPPPTTQKEVGNRLPNELLTLTEITARKASLEKKCGNLKANV